MASVQMGTQTSQDPAIRGRLAEQNRALLQQMALFREVSEAGVQALAAVAAQVSFKAGDPLFEDGDPGDRVYFVVTGEVAFSLKNAGGTHIPLETAKDGDFFGEVAVLEGGTRSAAGRALQETLALSVTKDDLLPLLTAHPDILLAMYRRTARRLGRTSATIRETKSTDPIQLFRDKRSDYEKWVYDVARFCGRPKLLGWTAAAVAIWIGTVAALGGKPFDGPWFNALSLLLALEALVITCIVLHSQNLQEDRESFVKEKETQANIHTETAVIKLNEEVRSLRAELMRRLPEAPPTTAVVVVPAETETPS